MVQLIYEKLPEDIAQRHVLLLDPILGTGWSIFKNTLDITITFLRKKFRCSISIENCQNFLDEVVA